jgi:hypothetical protein
MYVQDRKGGIMSRTSEQYPLTRSTTFGALTLERFILIEHVPYTSRVSLAARESRVPALLLLKVLLCHYKRMGLYLEAKRGLGLHEQVVDYIALELINMVQLKQNRLVCCKKESINFKCWWCKEAPSGKGLRTLHYKQEAACYACGC